MSLIAQFRSFFEPSVGSETSCDPEERLTVAALLILVAHADGRVLKVETDGLRSLLRSRFHLTDGQVERLIRHAAEVEETLDPTTTLVDRILHDVSPEDRPRLLGLAYRIAAIDGVVHDFEDDLIWRTGRLLDLSDKDLAAIKAEALKNILPDRSHG